MDNKTIGILGGGQLGRMIVEAAHRLNIKTVILDAEKSPAKQINALILMLMDHLQIMKVLLNWLKNQIF